STCCYACPFSCADTTRAGCASLSLHDALPVSEELVGWLQANGFNADVLSGDVRQNKRLRLLREFQAGTLPVLVTTDVAARGLHIDRKSTRLNSSHVKISYAVICLKK